jgi:hypothetical protein
MKEAKMSDINETFTERVDVTTQADGVSIGRLEIGTVSGSNPREDADTLRAEILTLHNRIAELEAETLRARLRRLLSVNEIRKMKNLPPIHGGDVLVCQNEAVV